MKQKSENIKSVAELAKVLGMSFQRVAYHRYRGNGPKNLDPESWRTFFAAQGRDSSAQPDSLHRAIGRERLAILKEDRHAKKRDNLVRDGLTVTTAFGQRFCQYLVGTLFFGQLDRLSVELPAILKGKTEIDIQTEVLEQIEGIKRLLRDKLGEIEAVGLQNEKGVA